MRSRLQNELPLHWEGEIRRRTKALDQAQHELRNAKMSGNQESAVQLRQATVNRAKQAIAEAEDKLRRIKKWNLNYDSSADPVAKRLENFRQFITSDLAKAVAHLRNVQKALEAYAETNAPSGTVPAAPAPAEETQPDEIAAPTETTAT